MKEVSIPTTVDIDLDNPSPMIAFISSIRGILTVLRGATLDFAEIKRRDNAPFRKNISGIHDCAVRLA